MIDNKLLNVVVFPYDDEMYPYLQHVSMLEGINIQILLSPNGWAIDKGHICNYIVQTALSKEDYDKIDTVWLVDSSNSIQEDWLFEVVENMLKHNKQIIFARNVQKEVYDKILQLVKNYSGNMIDVTEKRKISDINKRSLYLYDIYTPIISVAGVGERTDKFLVQLAIKKFLEEKDYHVVLVTSRQNSVFLHNTYTFPDFMNANIPTEYKIVLYNHFIKKIEQEEKPDVILTGISGGIMPVSKLQVSHFGIHAFEILNAINPDFLVMCLYGNNVSDKYVCELKKIMKYKFMTDVDCFYLSSTAQDVFTVNRSIPIEFFSQKQANIEKLKTKLEVDIDKMEKIYTEIDFETMGQYIINCLNENIETEIL